MAPVESYSSASEMSTLSNSSVLEKVGLRVHHGGRFKQEGAHVKYVGGQTYLEKVPSNFKYADLLHRLSEKVDDAVSVKWLAPGDDLDPEGLISLTDDSDLQEMFDEYFKAAKLNKVANKTFRLHLWLYKAEEEPLTPEEIEEGQSFFTNSLGKLAREGSTPRGMVRPMIQGDQGHSSFGSNNSSASAGTGTQLQGRRLAYTPALSQWEAPQQHPQEQEAIELVTWMNEQERLEEINDANWQAIMAHNINRAHDRTYDSSGWPHDRSPFFKATGAGRSSRLVAPGNANGGFCGQGSGFSRDNASPRLGLAASAAKDEHYQPRWGQGEALQAGLGAHVLGNGSPFLFYTQDPWKAAAGKEAGAGLASRGEGGIGSGPYTKVRPSIHLPSQLGSDVGDALQAAGTLSSKEYMEEMVAGIVEHALGGEADAYAHAGAADRAGPVDYLAAGEYGMQPGDLAAQEGILSVAGAHPMLQRTPSRLAITQDSVYRIPQAEIKVVHAIGEGTFGEVVLATNNVFGKVAVKWLKPNKVDKHKDKFWEEARMLAALNHPNVLRFYGVVTASPLDHTIVGIVTEYMPGSSLSHYLRNAGVGRIDLLQRAELAKGAVAGLSYLHEMNIVHFDLKPDNLLLDYALQPGYSTPGVKVADFGLSKQKFRKYVSGVRDLRGTLPYMAPELVSDPDHVTERADVWSLGMVFWEMLTMETPFQHLTPQAIISGLMVGQLKPDIPIDCEPVWRWLLDGCLQPRPCDRLSLIDILAQLDSIIAGCTMASPHATL